MIFKVIATYVDHQEKEERSLSTLFRAESQDNALDDGYRWAKNRHEVLWPDSELFMLHISVQIIGEIGEDGSVGNVPGQCLLRWRRDHSFPTTLEEAILSSKEGKWHICN